MKTALAVMILAALPISAGAAETVTGMRNGKPYFEATEKASVQGNVIAIDKAKRMVTVVGASGDTVDIECAAEVKNFAQVHVKDVVKLSYQEKLTVTVEPAGSPDSTTELLTASAKPGEKPSASATERTEYKATIMAIDKPTATVTLKGHDGKTFDVTVRHPENLDKISVGELAVFTYTQVVGVSVEKVGGKKK